MKIPIRIDISETTYDGETMRYTKEYIVFGFKVFIREYTKTMETAAHKTSGFDVFPDMRQEVPDEDEEE